MPADLIGIGQHPGSRNYWRRIAPGTPRRPARRAPTPDGSPPDRYADIMARILTGLLTYA